MLQERSFGIIPLIKEGATHRVLIVKLLTGYWGFPKGKMEKNESPKQTAARELREETNLEIVHYCNTPSLTEQYVFSRGGKKMSKQVTYFVAYVQGELVCQQEEILEAQWVLLSQVDQYILFKGTQALIQTLKTFAQQQLI